MRESFYRGIPLNSRGEPIYIIKATDVGFSVHSHASGRHHVDKYGRIKPRADFFQGELDEYLHRYQEIQILLLQKGVPYQHPYYKEFEERKKCAGETQKFKQVAFRFWLVHEKSSVSAKLKEIRET